MTSFPPVAKCAPRDYTSPPSADVDASPADSAPLLASDRLPRLEAATRSKSPRPPEPEPEGEEEEAEPEPEGGGDDDGSDGEVADETTTPPTATGAEAASGLRELKAKKEAGEVSEGIYKRDKRALIEGLVSSVNA